jgi:hypothetical protein
MRRLDPAPKADRITEPNVNHWFQVVTERLNFYQGAADPTTAEVPLNQWILYKNTTTSTVSFWFNDSGTLKRIDLI